MALERHEHRQTKEICVAVGEPFAPQEGDAPHGAEEARIPAAQGGAPGILLDVAAKGGKLPVALHDPIVPLLFEDWRRRGHGTSRRRRGGRNTWRSARNATGDNMRGGARCRVCGNDSPVSIAQGFRQLAHDHAQRDAIGRGLDLDQQMDVVRHHNEGRYLVKAAPFQMECANGFLEGRRDGVAHNLPIVANRGEIGNAGQPFERYHIEIRRFVIEVEKPRHGDIITYSLHLGVCVSARPRRKEGAREWPLPMNF